MISTLFGFLCCCTPYTSTPLVFLNPWPGFSITFKFSNIFRSPSHWCPNRTWFPRSSQLNASRMRTSLTVQVCLRRASAVLPRFRQRPKRFRRSKRVSKILFIKFDLFPGLSLTFQVIMCATTRVHSRASFDVTFWTKSFQVFSRTLCLNLAFFLLDCLVDHNGRVSSHTTFE